MLLAGGLVGTIGLWLPQVMGIGYDTVDQALNSGFAIAALALLLAGKLLATSLCIGLGVPGGIIGPSLFAGAMLGALVAQLALLLPLGLDSDVGFFALLGMGAMMSGSLQAPLAALTAMLELTDNPAIILPGMLAVVVAGLTASEVFGKRSLFLTMLSAGGLNYEAGPVARHLRRIGVASVMDRDFVRVERQLEVASARTALAGGPQYLVIGSGDEPLSLMPAVALARHLESLAPQGEPGEAIDLAGIPGERLQTGRIDLQANLEEAWQGFEQQAVDALLVERVSAPGIVRIYGVLTPDKVEKSYRH
jgi:hypothetical protein